MVEVHQQSGYKDNHVISWKPRLIERFSPERKKDHLGGVRTSKRRERRAFQEQGALGLILELEKRDSISRMERVVG
ncbi:hypothetical protein Lal_00041620 [Lupinus albus]|nr:hypothetical protein Lal_00041620 [Lupinus albus]